jgi:hypothetical protein
MGSGGIAPPFLESALDGGEWSASRPYRFTPFETAPQYPLYRRLFGPQSRSGRYGEDKNLSSLPGLEPRLLGLPACSLFAIPNELSRLRDTRVIIKSINAGADAGNLMKKLLRGVSEIGV